MQAHQETIKKYGHNRRPSFGKAMPISSLLMDLSGSPQRNAHDCISKDGLSPREEAQPVVFTFGHGAPRYGDDARHLTDLTNSFIGHEKVTGIAHRQTSVEPKQPVFLKCLHYRHLDETASVDKTDIENNANIAGDDKNNTKPCLTCNANENIQLGYDLKASDSYEPLVELCEALCDGNCTKTHPPSYSRSNSERQEFLASMLYDAQKAVIVEPVLMKSTIVEPEVKAIESESKCKTIEPELVNEQADKSQDPVDLITKDDLEHLKTELHIREEETNPSEMGFQTMNSFDRSPIVTEPDDSDADDDEPIVRRRFDPIDMDSNDTEPSVTDPNEREPIITYPDDTEDLIRFDDDDDAATSDSQLTIENLAKFDQEYFRNKLAVAEALAQATMMTSPAVTRRLAARKIEMDIADPDFVYDKENGEYIPPKQLLLYLVR